MAKVIVLEMPDDGPFATVGTQNTYPLWTIVYVQHVQMAKSFGQRQEPQVFLIPPDHGDFRHQRTGLRAPAGTVREWIQILALRRETEHCDVQVRT